MTSIIDYQSKLETILADFDPLNLTDTSITLGIYDDKYESYSDRYYLYINSNNITNLGETTKYYKNERATFIYDLETSDLDLSRAALKTNYIDIITELDRVIQLYNQTATAEFEITFDYDLIAQSTNQITFIMERGGIAL